MLCIVKVVRYVLTVVLPNAVDMKDFVGRLKDVDSGRFCNLLDSLDGLSNVCENCYYFNDKIDDPTKAYRCNCIGSCPAATLSEKLKKYLWINFEKIK